ncbi:hypothetical protein GH714_006002 [Hevea brasiliensis]|uniref:DYW domain-containing protein n=1 Tax=Hevea brasiliensis TaxID=3981 RepID=A0A6A6KY52_HEVBR|nr:hypothetical protein GH714_006002 [Hevea brasiliensis]
MLEVIETRVAEAGYVPNLSSVLHDIGEEEKENAIRVHSERLAIAFGFLVIGAGDCIRIVKNLRVCTDCHEGPILEFQILKLFSLARTDISPVEHTRLKKKRDSFM